MPRLLRFIAGLVLGLALLTWGGSHIVSRTTRAWFENDIRLRSRLAVSGAHDTLVSHWQSDQRGDLEQVLERITRDERIMAAAACGADLFLEARTPDYPRQLDCGDLGPHVRPAADAPAEAWTSWATIVPVSGGSVHATAIPLLDRGRPLGFVVLVHDLSFIETTGGDDAALPVARLRDAGDRGVARDGRGGAALVARVEQRAAAAARGREPAARVPAAPARRPRSRRAAGVRAGGRTAWEACGRRSASRTR